MKKILSLLSMLMITVTAFATSYTDKLTYKLTVFTALTKDLPAGELTIEPYGTSNYTVTAKGCDLSDFDAGNWDEIVCEDVAGTKDANGVTTITLDNPYAYRTSDNTAFTDTKLVVKFNGTKAYAHFEGKMKVMYVARAFEYTFGVDEGFDGGGSTGGGETGGEDKPAAFEKVDFVGDGTNFNWSIPVNWDTQKIVMSIDPSTCTGACEDIIGLGEVATAWDNTLHLYRKPDDTLQGYFNVPGGSNNNTNPFDETNPIKVEVSKAKGFVVNDVVKIPASEMSALFALSTVNMGTGEGTNDKSRATYNYVKVVDKDWTEVPPVTVKETKEFKNVAYTTSMGGSGTATVTFTEMSDDTFPMTFVSDDLNVKAENLTKGTDEKGRTTYTGTAKRTDVDVTFTVKAVVYGETTAQKLYMTMDNGSSLVVTVGEDPDYVAPVTYKNTLKVVRGTDTKAYENAEVSVLAKGENKYAVTIPSFTDMDATEGTIGKLTFEATGVEENGTLKLTATSATTTQEGGTGWDAAAFTASMDATVTGETLAGTFTVVYPNDATNYTYTLYYGVEPPTTPEAPKDVTVVEKYQADGSGFSKTINVDWDKQKIVASIDFSNGGDDKDILAMTTGDSFTAFQTSTYRTMHWYCNQTAKQISGFFAKDGAGNNNTGRIDVADCLAKFEISKAEGLKVNGEVKMTPTVLEELLTGASIIIGSGESPKFSKAYYNYIKVVSLDWKETTEPEVTVKDEKTFNEALYMQDQKVADATVVVKEMSDETINMSLKFGENEYTSTELTKGTDEKNRTTYTGKVANGTQTYDVAGVVYEKDNVARLYMTLKTSITTVVVGENPDAVTPDPGVTEESNKTYTSNLRILDGETTVVEEAEANVNIIKYSDESYKVTLKNVNMLNKTQDLVFVGKALIEEAPTEATEPLTIIAKSDEATTTFFGEEMSATFEITEVSAEEIKMGFVLNNTSLEYQGEFNYTEEETPEVYTNNLHIYDAAAPETDLFQADQAKVEFLATATGGFKLTLKDVTLNEKTQDLVFTGTLPTPQPGGQDPLAEEGETTPAEPAMVLNATADEATATFLGTTSATAVFNVIMNDEAETENDAFALTFTITAGEKTLGGEFNYEKQDTPDEKYPVSFDKTALNTSAHGRMLNSFSLQQAGKEKQTKSVKTSKAAYEDHTADEPFTVEAGSELTASFDYTGEWMHSFVYIDFDNDGQFSYKEGQWDQAGTDLVAFSFYSLDSNPKNDASGYNSVGDELTGDARNTYVAPSFKAPAKAGEYRIRFKFDWNCILPGGSSSILSDGGGVWDATLKVVEPVVDGISSINAEVANGETQLFTVNGVKLNKLQKGLNIVRTADGKVKKVLVK
jgi:hypothetical protein